MLAEQKEAYSRCRTYCRGCVCDGCHIKHLARVGFCCEEILLNGNINQNKGTQEGPTKIAKRYVRYDGCHGDQHLFDFILGIVGQTKGVAGCLHSAHVTRRDGTWVTVLLLSAESVCELWHEK